MPLVADRKDSGPQLHQQNIPSTCRYMTNSSADDHDHTLCVQPCMMQTTSWSTSATQKQAGVQRHSDNKSPAVKLLSSGYKGKLMPRCITRKRRHWQHLTQTLTSRYHEVWPRAVSKAAQDRCHKAWQRKAGKLCINNKCAKKMRVVINTCMKKMHGCWSKVGQPGQPPLPGVPSELARAALFRM